MQIQHNDISQPKPLTDSMQHDIRHDWTLEEVNALYNMPFNDLMLKHRRSIARILILIMFK